MKTYLTYGAITAFANAVLTLVLYLGGYHADASALAKTGMIAGLVMLAVTLLVLVLGIRARRAEVPADRTFSYGAALATGVMISVFAALFSGAFQYVYQALINPGYGEVVVQAQVAGMEAKGVPDGQIEQATKVMQFFARPALQAVMAFVGGVFLGALASLVIAAFVRRPAATPEDGVPAL